MPTVVFGALLALALAGREPVTFDEAVGLAAEHPGVRVKDAEIEARLALDRSISAVSNNPSVLVLPGWRLPGAESPGFEIQAQLTQTITLGGPGQRAQAAATAEQSELWSRRRLEALERRLGAARAWLASWRAQAVLRIVEEELAAARELVDRARRAVELGAALETELLEAESYRVLAERRRIDAEGIDYEEAVALASALGQDGAPLPLAEGPLPEPGLPAPSAWPQWVARADSLPSARVAAMSARTASARAAEADAHGSARLTPTLAAQLERAKDVILFAGLGVQLPLFDGNDRARSLAGAEARSSLVRAEKAAIEARLALRVALHEVEHTRELEALAEDQAVPTAERWAERSTTLFERGQSDVFPALRARGRLAEARAARVAATEDRVWSEVKAWLLFATLSETSEVPEP